MASLYRLREKGMKRKRNDPIDQHGSESDGSEELSDDAAVDNTEVTQPATKESTSGFKAIKHKVLVLSSRGVTARQRFLMNDLIQMLPHSKKDAKLDTKSRLFQLNELAELYNCNNVLFFEARKHQDLYMWMARAPNGPCFKLHVQNLHTMDELNLTGNCLRGSRPILSFDSTFDAHPHLSLLKELMTHIFGVPKGARRAKPFVDHVVTLTVADNKVWFRNYQIKESIAGSGVKAAGDASKARTKGDVELELVEIGPRFCMTIICVLEGSFGGPVIYENREFVSPNTVRRLEKRQQATKYATRHLKQVERDSRRAQNRTEPDELDDRILFAAEDK